MLTLILSTLRGVLMSRAHLIAENLALRQQIIVLQRSVIRPRIRRRDRVFWAWLSRLWPNWRSALVIVQPDTVIKWHRAGFRLYWRWKSRTTGRPMKDLIIRDLIREMSRDNPTWGAPRIRAELHLLGHDAAESTVARYMIRPRKPPSPTWRSFLANHAGQIAAIDFFTVYTITFKALYCFVVLSHDRRKILHFNVTQNPTAEWTAQQIIEAFPYDTAPRYLLHDRDSLYGAAFHLRVKGMGTEEVTTAYRSPWQNPYCERVIGSIRRDCLDHMIIFNEAHLRRILKDYFRYYHESRTHMALDDNSPVPREVEPPSKGPERPLPLLSRVAHAHVPGRQLADSARSRTTVKRLRRRDSLPRRSASSLHASCVNCESGLAA